MKKRSWFKTWRTRDEVDFLKHLAKDKPALYDKYIGLLDLKKN